MLNYRVQNYTWFVEVYELNNSFLYGFWEKYSSNGIQAHQYFCVKISRHYRQNIYGEILKMHYTSFHLKTLATRWVLSALIFHLYYFVRFLSSLTISQKLFYGDDLARFLGCDGVFRKTTLWKSYAQDVLYQHICIYHYWRTWRKLLKTFFL